MNRDKQTEIHELAKKMSEAISNEIEQRYIEDEAKLEAVLIANGWVKAEEIFAEIEKLIYSKCFSIRADRDVTGLIIDGEQFANLKKEYTERRENGKS